MVAAALLELEFQAESTFLARYLLEAEDGRHREALERALAEDLRGRSGVEEVRRAIPALATAALERRIRAWVDARLAEEPADDR